MGAKEEGAVEIAEDEVNKAASKEEEEELGGAGWRED